MLKITSSITKHLEGARVKVYIQKHALLVHVFDILKETIYKQRKKFISVTRKNFKEEWKLLGLDEPKEPRKRKLPF